MIIDIHAHALPQDLLDALAAGARTFPSVQLDQGAAGMTLSFAGAPPTRPVMSGLRDTAKRDAWVREQGVDVQLIGGWLDGFGYELSGEEGADWSRFQNEEMINAFAGHVHLIPLATVPLQDGRRAAQVLTEAVQAGMPGAMIGTQPHGSHGNLDDPDLDDFWSTAAELGAPIIVHPMFGSADARLLDYQMVNAVGRVTDVSIALSRLLFSGHLQRFDTLKLVASTGGGALPYMLGRLARNHAAYPGQFADPVEGFHRLYFDSIVFERPTLEFLVAKVGADRIMLGSDYPFPIGDPQPTAVITEGAFSDDEKALMLGDVARQLFALENA
ncbi:MAG: amidohydrolase [Gammaproteobacteria bacterium]|nr:amidohydrolase [Gammaproteobacteria bacterium]